MPGARKWKSKPDRCDEDDGDGDGDGDGPPCCCPDETDGAIPSPTVSDIIRSPGISPEKVIARPGWTIARGLGTIVATIDALGGRTTQVFDSAGRRTALIDAKANRTTFGFDDAGRNVLILDAVGNRTTWGYDAAGQQRFRIDGRGNRTTYVHDDAGRAIGRRYPDGSRATFAYDALGTRTKMHDGNGRTTYTFDDLQRLRTVANPANKKLTYGYDVIGQRRFLIEPEGGRFTTAYDDAGRIRFLVNPQGYRTSWTHDAADRVKVQYLGNSTRASYSYDDANRVLKLANIRTDATTISSFDYAYDSVGNRTRVIESDGVRVTWSYDVKYQLTRERRSGANAYDITYSYDAAGNRRVKLEDAIRTTYAYDVANQLRYTEDNTGRTTFTFDANGNERMVMAPSGSLTTNTWNFENKLTRVILPSGTRNTMAYDAEGKRVQKDDSSGTTKFVWDAENILVETNQLDVIQAVYTQEPVTYGNLISQYRTALTSFYHFDGLGSTDRVTSSLAIVTDSYAYKAYGILLASSGATSNSLKFVGRHGYYFDADLLQYMLRARPYDPARGRFLAIDPFLVVGRRDGNPYTYVEQRPVIIADPSGNEGGHWSGWFARLNPLCWPCFICATITMPTQQQVIDKVCELKPRPDGCDKIGGKNACKDGTECNALMHCYAGCLVTARCSGICTRIISAAREGYWGHTADDQMDAHNDIQGEMCVWSPEVCDKPNPVTTEPGWTPLDCMKCCQQKVKCAELWIVRSSVDIARTF